MLTLGRSKLCWLSLLGFSLGFMIMTAITVRPINASTVTDLTTTSNVISPPPAAPLPTARAVTSLTTPATAADPITGTFGTSPWSLQDGVLTIGAGDFASHTGNTSPWNAYSSQITTINITGPVNFSTNATGIFGSLGNLTAINGLSNINTSKTTSIDDLFYADSQLTDLTGIENWQTSNVRSMNRTFFATALVGTLDLSHWDVGSLTSTSMAFSRTGGLGDNSERLFKRLDLSGWNFKASKVGLSTFGYQLQVLDLDTSNWTNTSHISNMESMFTFSSLSSIDLSSFDMRQLAPYYGGTWKMFSMAWNLKVLKLGPYSKLAGTGLPDITETDKYTGYWQNIGTGTTSHPNGDQVLTTDQLVAAYDGTKTQATDTFVRQPKAAQPVTVHYVDANDPTTEIQTPTKITGAIDDPFTVTPPKIDGYTYQGVQDDVALTGTISGTAQDITLLYAKQGQVTVNYEDADGQKLAPSKTMTGDIGSAYTVETPTIDDYSYQSASANLSGNYTATAKTITLTYTKTIKTGTVTVNYHDEAGHSIATAKKMTGDVGTTYKIDPPTIAGYTYLSGELTGTYTAADQTVTLTYRQLPTDGQITVNYLDTDGHVLAEPTTMIGKLGSTYTIEPKQITGYTYQSGDLTGTYATTSHAVNLIYQKEAVQGTVTVNYEDEAGHQLAAPTTLTGKVGAAYTIEKKTIDGYTFHQGDLSGAFTATAKTVTLTYRKNAVAKGSVTVNYHDGQGKSLAPTETLTGDVDTPYTISQKVIAGYAYQKATGNLTGTFTATAKTVTLIYQPTIVQQGRVNVKYQSTTGQTLASDQTLTGDLDTTYTITPLKITGYQYQQATADLTGKFSSHTPTVTLTYTPVAADLGQVTANYLDLDGQVIAPLTRLSGALGTTYTTAAKTVTGYTYVKTVGNPTGTFKSQPQVVNYFYQKQSTSTDQRQLTGQNYTMTVDGPVPTVTDFKAKAKDKDGQTLTVSLDLSRTNRHKVGTYPITLSTTDCQTLTVKLFVIAATTDGNNDSAGDTINPSKKPGSSATTSSKPTATVKPTPLPNKLQEATTSVTTTDKPSTDVELPATGEVMTSLAALLGLLGLLSVSVIYFRHH